MASPSLGGIENGLRTNCLLWNWTLHHKRGLLDEEHFSSRIVFHDKERHIFSCGNQLTNSEISSSPFWEPCSKTVFGAENRLYLDISARLCNINFEEIDRLLHHDRCHPKKLFLTLFKKQLVVRLLLSELQVHNNILKDFVRMTSRICRAPDWLFFEMVSLRILSCAIFDHGWLVDSV